MSLPYAQDVSSAVAKLDATLLGVWLLLLIFICLLIFNPTDTVTSLVPLASIVLGFSFIFGHSAQMLFESVRRRRRGPALVLRADAACSSSSSFPRTRSISATS
jgi:hypothetical protein